MVTKNPVEIRSDTLCQGHRDQWELHHTVKVTDNPAKYPIRGNGILLFPLIPSGMLLASRFSAWCSLGLSLMYVAGVDLSFAHWMAVIISP